MTKAEYTFTKIAALNKEAISSELFRKAALKRISNDGFDPKALTKTQDQLSRMYWKHTDARGKIPKPSSYNGYGRELSGEFSDHSTDMLEDLVHPKLENTIANRIARIRGKKLDHMNYNRHEFHKPK